jgi:aryl sulfotransferase
MSRPVHYRSHEADSARWVGFPFRADDIVISSRPRTGTTWVQMICALLIFQRPELPAPLWRLSPWIDHLVVPPRVMLDGLAEQRHRRFIKTHTPLDGIHQDERVTFIVTARHPLDMYVSLCHHLGNIDHHRMGQLTGERQPDEPQMSLHDHVVRWIDADEDPRRNLDSLPGVLWHMSDAWSRRDMPNVVLLHYDDLKADLDGEMRKLAERLSITVPEAVWPSLVEAATFQRMRASVDQLVPDTQGFFKDTKAFFHRGVSGAGTRMLSQAELDRYHARAAALAPPDLLTWLHNPRPA